MYVCIYLKCYSETFYHCFILFQPYARPGMIPPLLGGR